MLFKIAFPAERFISIFFTEENLLLIFYDAVGIMCQIAATHADGMQFCNIFGAGDKCWHRPEWNSHIIHIETCHQYPDAIISHDVANGCDLGIKKLGFINANHIHIIDHKKDLGGRLNRSRRNGMCIVGHDLNFAVSYVHGRFKNLYFLLCDPGPVEAADQFFGLPGKHRAADHFDPPGTGGNVFFDEHEFLWNLFIFMAQFSAKVRKLRFNNSIMNQLNKTIVREEIQWLLEAIAEQFEAINAYEEKIPQIEFDIIMENIRKLYENLHLLNRMGDSFRHHNPAQTETPAIRPLVPVNNESDQTPKPEEKLAAQPVVKIKVDLASPELLEKEHHSTAKSLSEIDLFSTESVEFSEKLKETREKNYASERLSSQRKELKAAISINEKFLFINELFDGNLREYNITIETLNGFAELRQALEFLDLLRLKNLWESESVAFKRLRELVEQKF